MNYKGIIYLTKTQFDTLMSTGECVDSQGITHTYEEGYQYVTDEIDYVDLSTEQSIAGNKTFTDDVVFSKGEIYNSAYKLTLPAKSGTLATTDDFKKIYKHTIYVNFPIGTAWLNSFECELLSSDSTLFTPETFFSGSKTLIVKSGSYVDLSVSPETETRLTTGEFHWTANNTWGTTNVMVFDTFQKFIQCSMNFQMPIDLTQFSQDATFTDTVTEV